MTPRTCEPGATTSGFATPATTPRPEKLETVALRPDTSADPTVSDFGSTPGSPTWSLSLPAAATTSTPAARTCSTAAVSGSAPYAGAVGRSTARATLTT